MEYLITGATGDVGSKVVRILLELGERPRVFVRNADKARALFSDQVDIFVGDLDAPATLRPALDGIEGLFLLTTGPTTPRHDEGAAKAARAAGVRRLVKLSTMDMLPGLAIGAWHARGEEAIRASGVSYTFVRPTGFMSNLLAWTHSIKTEGVVRSSTGDGKRAFIHSDDIAAVGAEALTSGKYAGQALTITGPEALSFLEVTSKIGEAIGKRLRFQQIPDEEARQRYSAFSASQEDTDAHVSLWRAIREGRLADVTNEVERVLGRKPITFDQWAQENAHAFC